MNEHGPGEAMLGVGAPTTGHEDAKHPGSDAIVQVQQVRVPVGAQLGPDGDQAAFRGYPEDMVHMRVMAEQGGVHQLREHAYPGGRMAPPESSKKWSGEEDIADGAEPHGQDVWSWRVEHGVKVQRKRSPVNHTW
jgi:hypothetical protein